MAARVADSSIMATAIDLFDHDRFLLKQKRLTLTDTYTVYDERDKPALFVRREAHHLRQVLAFLGGLVGGCIVGAAFIVPAIMIGGDVWGPILMIAGIVLGIVAMAAVIVWLIPKRNIGFFADQAMTQELMKVYQDQKWVFINATYTAADSDFELLGWFRKNYLHNLVRKRWFVHNADGSLACMALEDSVWRSIARRLLGEYGQLIRTNFVLYSPDGETKLGEFNRKFTLFDKYVLDMSPDGARTLDRRLALALGVLLDTGEKR